MTRSEKAKFLFESGYNCSQSVFLAFYDLIGLSEETAIKLSAGFGGGFGRMREVCGAVCGMTAVISFYNADKDPNNQEEKALLYALIQDAINEFKAKNGSYICRELLDDFTPVTHQPELRTQSYYEKRPCGDLVKNAAEITEKYITKKKQ